MGGGEKGHATRGGGSFALVGSKDVDLEEGKGEEPRNESNS